MKDNNIKFMVFFELSSLLELLNHNGDENGEQ